MPSINEILEVAKALETKSVLPIAERCVAVRNRHASCRRCADACIADAITIKNNEISVDTAECVSCGACVAVCPTSAILPLEPDTETLSDDISKVMIATEGEAVIACARMAARREGNVDKYATVPCMARMSETQIIDAISHGAKKVTLIDGDCSTCKYKKANPSIDATVDTARALLAMRGDETPVVRVSKFPEHIIEKDDIRAIAAARRGFLTQAGDMAKTVGKTVAEKVIEQRLNPNAKTREQTLRERLGISKTGSLPKFDADRNMTILDALYELGETSVEELDSRVFGEVNIVLDQCTGCGMCARFCPTTALVNDEQDKPAPKTLAERRKAEADTTPRFLEFSVADCVQCRLCEDVCLQHCISVSSVVDTEELFDFEPRMIQIAKRGTKPNMLNKTKPANAKAAETKPADTKPTDGKTADTPIPDPKTEVAKSTDAKPGDAKPTDTESASTKPADAKPADNKPAESEPTSSVSSHS